MTYGSTIVGSEPAHHLNKLRAQHQQAEARLASTSASNLLYSTMASLNQEKAKKVQNECWTWWCRCSTQEKREDDGCFFPDAWSSPKLIRWKGPQMVSTNNLISKDKERRKIGLLLQRDKDLLERSRRHFKGHRERKWDRGQRKLGVTVWGIRTV